MRYRSSRRCFCLKICFVRRYLRTKCYLAEQLTICLAIPAVDPPFVKNKNKQKTKLPSSSIKSPLASRFLYPLQFFILIISRPNHQFLLGYEPTIPTVVFYRSQTRNRNSRRYNRLAACIGYNYSTITHCTQSYILLIPP